MIEFPKVFDADPRDMDREELQRYLSLLQNELSDLDAREPKNSNSDAYEAWAEEHEELEDLMDEVLDRLDELDG